MNKFEFKLPSEKMNSTFKSMYIQAIEYRFASILKQGNKLTKSQAESIMCCNRTLIPQGFPEYEINITGVEIIKEKKLKKVATLYDSSKYKYI